jgi:hypothetical protein
MPLSVIGLYAERLPEHLAAIRGMMNEAASYPYMSEGDRWAVTKRLEAYAERKKPARRATSEDLRRIGIADVRV